MASAEPYTRRISCPFMIEGRPRAEMVVYIECIMAMDRLSRRDFLHVTAGVGAFASVASPVTRHALDPAAPAPDAGTGWFDKPMRWVQLTLVENDPGTFD